MATSCSVFAATSLDGFLARPDGAVDWLERATRLLPSGEDCGYAQFVASVDALVVGRATFQQALGFPEWPYGGKPVYVLSRSLAQLPAGVPDTVHLLSETPQALVRLAEAHGHTSLYVDGGRTIEGFFAAGLITDLTITVIPILLGTGIRLFGPLPRDVSLRHVGTTAYPFGFVQSRYAISSSPGGGMPLGT